MTNKKHYSIGMLEDRKAKPRNFSVYGNKFDDVFDALLKFLTAKHKIYAFYVFAECAECSECKKIDKLMRCKQIPFRTMEAGKRSKSSKSSHFTFRFFNQDGEKVHFLVEVVSSSNSILEDLKASRNAVNAHLTRISGKKFTSLRDSVVQASLNSPDSASFSFRCLNRLKSYIDFDGASIFLSKKSTKSGDFADAEPDRLELSASTGITKIDVDGYKKHDIFYFVDSKSYTAKSFNERKYIFESSARVLKKNTYGENVNRIKNRLYFPIKVRDKTIASGTFRNGEIEQKKDDVYGVIRLVNLKKDGQYTEFTKVDQSTISYFSEFIAVLCRLYELQDDPTGALDRATHGFVHDLVIIGGRTEEMWLRNVDPFLSKMEKMLKSDLVASKVEVRSEIADMLIDLRHNVENFKNDILGIQESMSAQLHSVVDASRYAIGMDSDVGSQICSYPYRQVLMRLNKSLPFICKSHNRAPAKISYFNDGLSDQGAVKRIPPLRIDPDIFYLVLRNLAENSVKYTPSSREGARIICDWKLNANKIQFLFYDLGPGIPEKEQKFLFRERFRGRHAPSLSTRGTGLGLAYCKRTLELFGASIEYVDVEQPDAGAAFLINLRKK